MPRENHKINGIILTKIREIAWNSTFFWRLASTNWHFKKKKYPGIYIHL